MKILLLLLLVCSFSPLAAQEVGYPKDYRSWSHVKSMLIQPGHPLANPFAGIHHIYANAKAVRGLKSGRYADGAVFVFDLLHYQEQNSAISEGKRKLVGVMLRDSRRFAATGGWGFEGFAGDSTEKRLTKDGGKSCFSCHQQKKTQGFVFTRMRN